MYKHLKRTCLAVNLLFGDVFIDVFICDFYFTIITIKLQKLTIKPYNKDPHTEKNKWINNTGAAIWSKKYHHIRSHSA